MAAWKITVQILVLALTFATLGSAQRFERTKMYVAQDHEVNLVKIGLELQESNLIATVGGKTPQAVKIPYAEITRMEYEHSKHRRWKMGFLGHPLMLLSKAKKHWLGVFHGEEDDEVVFQLSKRNYRQVLVVLESKTGKKVDLIVRRGG